MEKENYYRGDLVESETFKQRIQRAGELMESRTV